MPELPEVETTKNGIKPHLLGRIVESVVIRQANLRWPVPTEIAVNLKGRQIVGVSRRAKYILINFQHGTLIMHLGMSGSLRIVNDTKPHTEHEHVDIVLSDHLCLRYRDPRRFGTILWTEHHPYQHPLLEYLGPEPFDPAFDGAYLYRRSHKRKLAVKAFIMDSHVVTGVGNIYANEALFWARIHPKRHAGKISEKRFHTLAESIRNVLHQAIVEGGTTLRDFVNEAGRPGYFQQTLKVYSRGGENCSRCDSHIRRIRLNQRSTYYCPSCQR